MKPACGRPAPGRRSGRSARPPRAAAARGSACGRSRSRASTGTPARSAACSTASSSGIATGDLLLHRRVLGVLERDHDQVGGHERRVLGARDPDRGREHGRVERAAGERHEDPRRPAVGGRARGRRRQRERDRRERRRRPPTSAATSASVIAVLLLAQRAVGDDADVDAGQLADELRDERAAQDLGAPRLVGRADEDVGRAALGDEPLDRLGQVVALELDEVRAEDAREPAQRRERDRLLLARAAAPGRRTQSASISEPSRCAERNARRRIRCERGSGVTSTRIRSATACWLSGSSTAVVPPRLDVLGELAQDELAQRREVVEPEEVLRAPPRRGSGG